MGGVSGFWTIYLGREIDNQSIVASILSRRNGSFAYIFNLAGSSHKKFFLSLSFSNNSKRSEINTSRIQTGRLGCISCPPIAMPHKHISD